MIDTACSHPYTAPVVVSGNQTVPNHGIVDRNDIGEQLSNSLQCLTNNLYCCDQNSGAFWYYPNMTKVPASSTDYTSKADGPGFGVSLNRLVGGTQERIFHGRIPDEKGDPYNQYVGVYGHGTGMLCVFSPH